MRSLKGLVWGCALAALAALANPAHAGWNNVFQVCCNHCGGASPAPTVAAYADPGCCPTPPTTTCTTRYIQRTYYQPVTTYRMSTYYQPVTTYRTSYYYEPVCSYRYSCYYDPCTCSYQTVATPVTSYRLRSQCCPVTSYLQRCCMTPVTTYRAACYYEPVTTCCQTSNGAPVTSVPPGTDATPAPASQPPAAIDRSRFPENPPGTADKSDHAPPEMPPAPPASRKGNKVKPPVVRYDRIASNEGNAIAGRLLDGGKNPLSNAKVLFVAADRKSNQFTTTTDRDGNFRTRLTAGGWLVYTYDHDGKPVFSRRVEVPSGRGVEFTLVSR